MSGFYQQRDWNDDELRAQGFEHYERRKRMMLARQLGTTEKPLQIRTDQGDILNVKVGYYLVYDAGEVVQASLHDYYQWPVDPHIFESTYRAWDEAMPPLTAAEQDLLNRGCQPYYKAAGVWAKSLEEDTYIQSMEHDAPVLIQQGRVIAIGSEGEPYHMSQESFVERYTLERNLRLRLWRLWRALRKRFDAIDQ